MSYTCNHKEQVVCLNELQDIPPREDSRRNKNYHQGEESIYGHAYISTVVIIRYLE